VGEYVSVGGLAVGSDPHSNVASGSLTGSVNANFTGIAPGPSLLLEMALVIGSSPSVTWNPSTPTYTLRESGSLANVTMSVQDALKQPMATYSTSINYSGVAGNGGEADLILHAFYPVAGQTTSIAGHVRTPSDDEGDSRAEKQYGDIWMDYDSGGTATGIVAQPLLDNWTATLPSTTLGAGVSGRSQTIIDINAGAGQLNRNLALDLSWSSTLKVSLYEWQPSYLVKAVNSDQRASDWMDAGYDGAKWVQGCILEADTSGVTKSVQVVTDCSAVGATLSVNHPCQQEVPYSFTPFIAHLLKLQPTDTVPWRLYSVRWIWEPEPELATTWQTQGMTHGIDGFQHIRDLYIALISTSAVTLTLGLDSGVTQTYTIPSTGGVYAKVYLVAQPNKSKLYSYGFTSTAPYRLFQNDCEVRVKGWRDGGPYQTVRPFGDTHAVGAAKI
jgi:hypothetical protein